MDSWNASVIDLDAPFEKAKWINAGKTYPDAVPPTVFWARDEITTIPQGAFGALFPVPSHVPPRQFIDIPLPCSTSDLVTVKAALWFSRDPPTTDVQCLMKQPIPSIDVLSRLESIFGQAWFDGMLSVVDPRFNNGSDRFPLWVIHFWRELRVTIQHQGEWRRAIDFVTRQKERNEVNLALCAAFDEVWSLLNTVGWDEILPDFNISSRVLSTFLSTSWLSDEHINLMIGDMNLRLDRQGGRSKDGGKVIIAPLAFTNKLVQSAISRMYDGPCEQLDSVISHFETVLSEDQADVLFAPAHLDSEYHWIGLALDFGKGQLKYGDSLCGEWFSKPPSKLVSKTQLWLRKRLNRRFVETGNTLPHGIQNNSYDCGICVGNMIEHAVFDNVPLWEPQDSLYHRARWFSNLCKDTASWRALQQGHLGSRLEETHTAVHGQTSHRPSIADLLNPMASIPLSHDFGLAPCLSDSDSDSLSEISADEASRDILEGSNIMPLSVVSGADVDADIDSEFNALPPNTSSCSPPTLPHSTSPPAPLQQDPSLPSTSSLPANPRKDAFSILMQSTKQAVKKSALTFPGKKRLSTSLPDDEMPQKKKGPGTSRSAVASHAVRASIKNGTFALNPTRQRAWQAKLHVEDARVRYKDDSVLDVQHSTCGTWLKVKEPYDITRFRSHIKDCQLNPKKYSKAGANCKPVNSYFGPPVSDKTATSRSQASHKGASMVPCPGIAVSEHPAIEDYLMRSGSSGGGGKSISIISQEKYSKPFRDLKEVQRDVVLNMQEQTHQWHNRRDDNNLQVVARQCQQQVPDISPHRLQACPECIALLRLESFKKALKRKKKDEKNFIYVNNRFRPGKVLGDIYARCHGIKELVEEKAKKSLFVRYALGALRGQYNNKVFEGLTEAMVTQHDKETRGVGLQNFQYAPAYDEFLQIINIHSPSAYRAFRESLPGRTQRSFRMKEARQPRFPTEICDRTYERVLAHMKGFNYTGPVGLSCDDTKLFSTLRLYWDSDKKKHYLIGGTAGPIEVNDPEAVKQVISDAKIKKATKIRLWCLTLQVPKSTPIVVHAMPIGAGMNAPTLEPYSRELICGLITRGVRVVSYACDGTESERALQRLLIAHADRILEYDIPSPKHGGRAVKIIIPVFNGQPVVMIQDSKHGLKTLRNNLFSGARLLILGGHCAFYAQMHEVAHEVQTPLYERDVVKLDRQDDNAASRLFTACTLEHTAGNHPDWAGTVVYLFVFGELIDAYQNRRIDHSTRITMVLRARYVLDLWSDFLEVSGYSKSLHFLSREALDITRIIIEGYLGLLYVYRDHLPNDVPLLPWLHSSESCEHSIGICRHIVKDFCYLDFLYMAPKIHVSLRQAILRSQAMDPKARASGYCHTYFDVSGINALVLATFPDDNEIKSAACVAFQEADLLFIALGIDPSILRRLWVMQNKSSTALPSISTWLEDPNSVDTDSDSDSDDESLFLEAEELQMLLDQCEIFDTRMESTRQQGEKLLNLSCAAVALNVDDHMKVQAFIKPADDAEDAAFADEYAELKAYWTSTVTSPTLVRPIIFQPSVMGREGVAVPSPHALDFANLVDLRERHQTRHAERAVRVGKKDKEGEAQSKMKQLSPRIKLIKEMQAALKETQERGLTSGTERAIRTKALSAKEGSQAVLSGNAANAAVTAGQAIKAAALKRRRLFAKALGSSIRLADVVEARVTPLNGLHVGDYVLVLDSVKDDGSIFLGKVIAFYSKSSAKTAKHEAVLDSKSSICAFSNIALQLFEYQDYNTSFSSIHEATALLQSPKFALLPSIQILTRVKRPTISTDSPNAVGVERAVLTSEDLVVFTVHRPSEASEAVAYGSFGEQKAREEGSDT